MYDPYGRVTVLHGEAGADLDIGEESEWDVDSDGTDWDNEILYCGYRYDPEMGLYHVRHRMYHAQLGRWLTRDPIGDDHLGGEYEDGMDLYQYVKSTPTRFQDGLGLLTHGTVSMDCEWCGPDITIALQRLLNEVTMDFIRWSLRQKIRHCYGRYRGSGWDTDLFNPKTRKRFRTSACPTGSCTTIDDRRGLGGGAVVTVGGRCYDTFDVNYVLWGRMNTLCKLAGIEPKWPHGTLIVPAWKLVTYGGSRTAQALHWTLVGELGVVFPPSITTTRPCTPCPHQVWHGRIGWFVSNKKPPWWLAPGPPFLWWP